MTLHARRPHDARALSEMRSCLQELRARIDEVLGAWPPGVELAELLAHDLGYAQHVAEAVELDARAREEERRAAN